MAAIASPRTAFAVPAPRKAHRRVSALWRLAPGATLIGAVALAALAGPALVPYAPDAQTIGERLGAPSAAHLLGTDAFGRDVLSRLLAGARISLAVGVLSMVVTVGVGVAVGAVAGYFGGKADALLMRLTELVMVFPTFFLIILVVASFGSNVALLVLVIGLTSWPVGARIVRGEVLRTKARDFILAAHASGATSWRIIARHVLPSVAAVIIVSATIRIGVNILLEAGLSYLGLGVQPPLASWGNMIAEGARVFRSAPWLVAFPAAAMFAAVLGINLLGESLRDVLDPRLGASRAAGGAGRQARPRGAA
ncbi:MAG: ABC transporter permease [Candidatus Limnocylindria bacterium]